MKMMQNRSAFLLVMLMLTGLFCACDGADEVVTAKQSRVEISAKVAFATLLQFTLSCWELTVW